MVTKLTTSLLIRSNGQISGRSLRFIDDRFDWGELPLTLINHSQAEKRGFDVYPVAIS